MNNKDIKFFAAEIGAEIPTLDLHGFYPEVALEKMDYFLYQCLEKKQNMARIIYGGGTGKLKEEVIKALKKFSIVTDYRDSGGSCIIMIE